MSKPTENRCQSFEPEAQSPRRTALPVMHYWEVLWNRLHLEGWRLKHTTWSSPETGGIRHFVSARRGTDSLEHSAPTMTETMSMIARAVLDAERQAEVQTRLAKNATH